MSHEHPHHLGGIGARHGHRQHNPLDEYGKHHHNEHHKDEHQYHSKAVNDHGREETMEIKDVYMSSWVETHEVNIGAQQFVLEGTFNLFWRDKELQTRAFWDDEMADPKSEELPPEHYLPWVPGNLFHNDLECEEEPPRFSYDKKSWLCRLTLQIKGTFEESYELERFPYDRQFLNICLRARGKKYGWNWLGKRPTWVPEEAKGKDALGSEEFDNFQHALSSKISESVIQWTNLDPWVDFSSDDDMLLKCRLERDPAYYTAHYLFPCFIIIMCAFPSYAIPPSDVADRLSVNVTMLLAVTIFGMYLADCMPKGGQITILDIYLNLAFIFVAAIIAENCCISLYDAMDETNTDDTAWWDIACYAPLALCWVVVNLFFFLQTFDRFNCLRQSWPAQLAEDSDKLNDDQYAYVNGLVFLENEEDIKTVQKQMDMVEEVRRMKMEGIKPSPPPKKPEGKATAEKTPLVAKSSSEMKQMQNYGTA